MGSKNNPGAFDCYANAHPDEPMFVLLGRDRDAPMLVRLWALIRERGGESAGKVEEARACASAMERWNAKAETSAIQPESLPGLRRTVHADNGVTALREASVQDATNALPESSGAGRDVDTSVAPDPQQMLVELAQRLLTFSNSDLHWMAACPARQTVAEWADDLARIALIVRLKYGGASAKLFEFGRNEWRDAILDACVVDWILTAEHQNDPRKAVNDLLHWQQQIALDPAVSEPAAKLHARIAELEAELTRLRGEREELIDALEEYGAHDLDDCGGDGEEERCTCGLDDLLARLRGDVGSGAAAGRAQ